MPSTNYPATPTPGFPEEPLAADELAHSMEKIKALLMVRFEQRSEAQSRLHFLQHECDALECALNALGESSKTIDSWKNDVTAGSR